MAGDEHELHEHADARSRAARGDGGEQHELAPQPADPRAPGDDRMRGEHRREPERDEDQQAAAAGGRAVAAAASPAATAAASAGEREAARHGENR